MVDRINDERIISESIQLTQKSEAVEDEIMGFKTVSYNELLRELLDALHTYHRPTYLHSADVSKLASVIAERLKLPNSIIRAISVGGFLHDIGKLWVPLETLASDKDFKKESVERYEVDQHPVKGVILIDNLDMPDIIHDCIYFHHENYDGSGYPERKAGRDIPLAARIVCIADKIRAMREDRPYSPSIAMEKVAAELVSIRGRLCDPYIVDACLGLYDEGLLEPSVTYMQPDAYKTTTEYSWWMPIKHAVTGKRF